MDYIINSDYSIRKIATIFHISKSTVQNYKKFGPPFLRKFLKTNHVDPRFLTWLDNRELLIKYVEKLQQAKNQDNTTIQTLRQDNQEKDFKINQLTTENKALKTKLQEKDQTRESIIQWLQKEMPKLEHLFLEKDTKLETLTTQQRSMRTQDSAKEDRGISTERNPKANPRTTSNNSNNNRIRNTHRYGNK